MENEKIETMQLKYIFTLADNTEKEVEITINRENYLSGHEIFNVTANKFTTTVLYSTIDINSEIIKTFEELITKLNENFHVRVLNLTDDVEVVDLNNTSLTITIRMNNEGKMTKDVILTSYN